MHPIFAANGTFKSNADADLQLERIYGVEAMVRKVHSLTHLSHGEEYCRNDRNVGKGSDRLV